MTLVNSLGSRAYPGNYQPSKAKQSPNSSLLTAKGSTVGGSSSKNNNSANFKDMSQGEVWSSLPKYDSAVRKMNISNEVLYSTPDNVPYPDSITKHTSSESFRTWSYFPGGKDMGESLKEILSPYEYKMAMMATAGAGGTGTASKAPKIADALQVLEADLQGEELVALPLEEREWYHNMIKAGYELAGKVDEYKRPESDYIAPDAEIITYNPREDFLKLAVEAKDNLDTLLNVVNDLDGLERAQTLHHLANGDWQYMRNELGKVADTPADQLSDKIQRLFESKELGDNIGHSVPMPFDISNDGIHLTAVNL